MLQNTEPYQEMITELTENASLKMVSKLILIGNV